MKRRSVLAAAAALTGCALAPGVARAASGDDAYRARMAAFDASHHGDVWLEEADRALLVQVVRRLERVQSTVGFGNFGVMGFDRMLAIARGHASVGAFTAPELAFLERVFFTEASRLGFRGRKVVPRLTEAPPARDVLRVPGTAARLFRGPALEKWRRMRAEVGEDLVLTSGVRGVVKQFHLFLRKVQRADGNLSLASRSLAPPGYSYHGIGDFDVGQRGYGVRNFRADFAATPVHARLVALGHARLRYPAGNLLGVRYEPWHIRVVG